MWIPWLGARPPLGGGAQDRAAVAMVAVRPGDQVLVVGAAAPGLAAGLALVAGLNGAVTVMDDAPGAARRIESAATKAGALVTFDPAPPTALSVAEASVDVAVLVRQFESAADADRRARLVEALRVVRPGGRLVVIERAAGRVLGLFPHATGAPAPEAICDVVRLAGWRSPRPLEQRGGTTYVEAIKGREGTTPGVVPPPIADTSDDGRRRSRSSRP